jgi:hypothetical protein
MSYPRHFPRRTLRTLRFEVLEMQILFVYRDS